MALSLAPWRWAERHRLPRDARDTLFLLGVIAWLVLPHVGRLPLWCSLLTAAVLFWRARIAWLNLALPPRWVLLVTLAVAAALTWWSHRTLIGKEPGITLVVAMLALKTLELRARRDAFVVFFLGFFIVLTQFLGSQSLPVAASMLISVWGLLTALVLAHMPVGRPRLIDAGWIAGRTALLGAPLMAMLFMLFPRIGPLWGVPQPGGAATGLSTTLRMGSVAELAQDETIALRLRFDGAPPPSSRLYFRGPVLSRFDGRDWWPLDPSYPETLQPRTNLQVAGPRIRYEITIEPQRTTSLPLLEMAPDTPEARPRVPMPIARRDDLEWIAVRPVTERLRFASEAYLDFRHGPTEPIVGLQDYLSLPPGYNPRTLGWAAALRRQPGMAEASADTLAEALYRHIRSEPYEYTLEPGTYGDEEGRHAVDEFWLDRRAGFCEHYASAFVVIMRALDVPARIVTGYQGADLEPVDGYVIVRNSHAHAWAEYWQAGKGWVRADPTAAVAPWRITQSRSLAARPGVVASTLDAVNPRLLAELRRSVEAWGNRWNQWVLNYSRSQQTDLLQRLGFESPRWQDLVTIGLGLMVTLALGGAAWAAWDHRRQDPWERVWRRVLLALATIDVLAPATTPPRSLARLVRERHGRDGEAVATSLEVLDRLRYGAGGRRLPERAWQRQHAAAVQALRRRLRSAADNRAPSSSAPR